MKPFQCWAQRCSLDGQAATSKALTSFSAPQKTAETTSGIACRPGQQLYSYLIVYANKWGWGKGCLHFGLSFNSSKGQAATDEAPFSFYGP